MFRALRHDVEEFRQDVQQESSEVVEALKPKLRGWLHAGTFPFAVVAGVVLVVLAPPGADRIATAVYAVTAALLFGVSATFHRGTWSGRAHGILRRLDHSNIFLIIAGTYTPFSTLLLERPQSTVLLWIVWGGALAGVSFRVLWVGAPRWLYTPVYIALGWVAVFFIDDFVRTGGWLIVVLLVVGGLLYSAGGIVYAAKRPDPSPRWFGFHEVFHALTLGGFLTHYIAVSLVAVEA